MTSAGRPFTQQLRTLCLLSAIWCLLTLGGCGEDMVTIYVSPQQVAADIISLWVNVSLTGPKLAIGYPRNQILPGDTPSFRVILPGDTIGTVEIILDGLNAQGAEVSHACGALMVDGPQAYYLDLNLFLGGLDTCSDHLLTGSLTDCAAKRLKRILARAKSRIYLPLRGPRARHAATAR
jgi:hypothetical protein